MIGDGLVFLQVSARHPELISDIKDHYTGSRGSPVGKKIVWRIIERGRMRGFIAIGEPSFKLGARRRLGIEDARPLPHTVNNWFFRLVSFDGVRASTILKVWHDVAASEWEDRYGWRPIHWETMVDEDEVRTEIGGYCYRRAGYRSLGYTTGWGAVRRSGDWANKSTTADAKWAKIGKRRWVYTGKKKLVLYRGPLARLPKTGSPTS